MKLENVLKFFSGHINIPPSDLCITLMFTHTSKYPSTSTCSIELHIPINLKTLDMQWALQLRIWQFVITLCS